MSKLTNEEFRRLKEAGYSDTAIDLYRNKANVGVIDNPDATSAYRAPCGDAMQLSLRISDRGVVEDAKFQYFGCPGAASSGSAITTIVKGKTLAEAKKITEEDVLQELGGLPETKLHCPKLAVTTLLKTLVGYEEHKRSPSKHHP